MNKEEDTTGGIDLHTREETIDIVVSRIKSGQWWIFIYPFLGGSDTPLTLMNTIETKYYTPGTEKNRDFEIIMGFDVSYAFAKKTRMNKAELADILLDYYNSIQVAPEQKDALEREKEKLRSVFMADTNRDVIPMIDYDSIPRALIEAMVDIDDLMGKQKTRT